MTCLDCGAALKVRHNQTVAYDFGGLPDVSLAGLDVRVCTNGHREIVIPMIEGLHRTIATALTRKPYLLAHQEIRFLRKYLGYSQADFAATMGVAAESVSRWETGATAMAATADRLLRLMVLSQEPIQDYKIFDLFARLKDRREPTRMKLRHTDHDWAASTA